MFLYYLIQFLTLKTKNRPKMCNFKTWKKFGKPERISEKTSCHPVNLIRVCNRAKV